jgi:hypothetical protein
VRSVLGEKFLLSGLSEHGRGHQYVTSLTFLSVAVRIEAKGHIKKEGYVYSARLLQ